MTHVEVIPARDLIALDFSDKPIKLTNEYDTARYVMDNYCNGEALMTVLERVKLTYRMWLNILRLFPELRQVWDDIQDIHVNAVELSQIQCIQKAAKTEWRAALAILERRYPHKWAKKTHHINENIGADHPEGARTILADFEEVPE